MPQPKSVSAFPARPPLLTPPQSRRLSDAHHDVTAHGSHRSTPRRDRVTAADVYDKGASSRSLRKRRSSEVDVSCPTFYDGEHERTDAPLSRYVQMSEGEEDFDAFENVEYVLTERYRDDPRASAVDPDVNTPKSGAWRLISSIGSPFTKRKTDADEDVYQSTLAMGQSRLQPNKAAGKGRRQLTFFGLRGTKNDDVWLEFSCSLPVERLLNEVGKITKSLGYQVWRRPSENKLRCIRQLNHRHEMHMVIFVGSIRLPEGIVSMVRLKRARGDRNRTPAWRYSNFYRELMERLQRNGIPVTSDS
ncbi:unnamed protein product [Chondrus crispus]|uniref:Uncharacterized protein n=1 Tax=Chondrus crispus TaxID=2769 RepID=R7QI76_CHOCR|nr:unnamed protein product [Chondrus crispus]CDF37115.1 unnamed protein product [Chondrus crispus]|eukprot:XP_005716934.1 unnamed protein product [Chondrus crispus]